MTKPFSQIAAQTIATFPTPTRKDGPSGRFYEVDGLSLPSVTHILSVIGKPALINWAANTERAACIDAAADLYVDLAKTPPMSRPTYISTLDGRIGKQKSHRRQLEKAGEIGSQTHALIEWTLRRSLGQAVGPEPRVVDQAQWGFMAWEDWSKSVSLKPKFIEQIVFSKQYGYAGTMDLLAEVNGVLTLVDFKTSKAIYPEALLQTTAYIKAVREMGHLSPEAGLVVRLPKNETDPAFETQPVTDIDALFGVFLAVIELWRWHHANEEAYRCRKNAAS